MIGKIMLEGYLSMFYWVFVCSIGDWTWGLTHARQALYHLVMPLAFCCILFLRYSLATFSWISLEFRILHLPGIWYYRHVLICLAIFCNCKTLPPPGLGIEPRALCMLPMCSTTWAMSPALLKISNVSVNPEKYTSRSWPYCTIVYSDKNKSSKWPSGGS
jgi:hypothetical protein